MSTEPEQPAPEPQPDVEHQLSALRQDRLQFELDKALGAHSCRQDARADILKLIGKDLEPTFDQSGRITRVKLEGKSYATLSDAVELWLGSRPYLAEPAPAPAAPAPRAARAPASPPSRAPEPELSPQELAARAWGARAR